MHFQHFLSGVKKIPWAVAAASLEKVCSLSNYFEDWITHLDVFVKWWIILFLVYSLYMLIWAAFIHPVSVCWACYDPGTVLGTEDKAVSKTRSSRGIWSSLCSGVDKTCKGRDKVRWSRGFFFTWITDGTSPHVHLFAGKPWNFFHRLPCIDSWWNYSLGPVSDQG